MEAAVTIPSWVQAGTAVLWAAATAAAAVSAVVFGSMRRLAWPAVWVPLALLSGWWACLGVRRWTGGITTGQYRDAVAPLVPALYVLWALNAAVFTGRALSVERRNRTLTRAISERDGRYGDGE